MAVTRELKELEEHVLNVRCSKCGNNIAVYSDKLAKREYKKYCGSCNQVTKVWKRDEKKIN